ncbi:hypothetical protein VD0002_g9952 [Verticillium dahliae]|uniref:Uncharacterized protein n=2 Tax=Verticillium dahliae TaxID=27337 RepID=G2XFH5_VERDV|nr:uncharacterized protein VDAG_09099 [Verticillium dahliae VdLs.17]KAF3347948.1 hypothetical protein VdG2_03926 [Verticillium dahliae VDG2]KAH6692017.1 hypothetical protein EV126DRAFT_514252 [Verticillium dahliae]EGY18573.1 hypothetical protein VDAG_09099 [Verticillium dahliae VdLs.17]PNH28482.1 hypothetical protein BJF96_g8175 [Verticillium dahliae]PNH45432.1 hypothetical protein VD0004_g2458 [Verticillium dahliae]
MTSAAPGPSRPPNAPRTLTPKSVSDPVLRNALRYTISAREYATLHKYVISRSRVLRRTAPSVATVEKMVDGDKAGRRSSHAVPPSDGYNTRAIRDALRLFVGTAAGMKTYDVLMKRVLGQRDTNAKKQPLYNSPTFRLSLSLSSILLLYRLLFRFMSRLRGHLLDDAAIPFRRRNPRTAATLTSPYAPAVGASLAGLALGVYPAQQLRVSVAIYAMFRALEFGWNLCEGEGMIWGFKAGGRVKRERPWWWGSWMIQPFAFGQLLHAVVFDRDCFPAAYGNLIFNNSTAYLQHRPAGYPSHLVWPKTWDIVDSLAQMAKLNWPPYISPTLFPNKETLPASLAAVAPLTSTAHPIITSLSCATLHPSDPSCLRTYLQFWLSSFPPFMRMLLGFYGAFAILPNAGAKLYHAPVAVLTKVLGRALRSSTFLAGSISTAWASICVFQTWLPRHVLPTLRFFLGGFIAGLWAWVERKQGRGMFLYSARASVDSLWKVGVKRRWWKGMRGGDVWVFVAALMVTGVVYERDARAIREGSWRRGVSWIRGEGLRDWSLEEEEVQGESEGEGRE